LILGDGTQSKHYIHVSDILNGIWLARQRATGHYNYFNLATDDGITVTQIAEMVISIMGLGNVVLKYTGGDRGWKGDIPLVRMDTSKIKALGWRARLSTGQALEASIRDMYDEAR
jgi:UDP-glucose 4-epimerase